ncbi:hypothetical protein V5799_023632 [Amblyomma americanum]|uniref:Nucleoporin n=1 Tax=Amblyomma americanum TaxID=6943 RepID=A0AAQ4FJ16_AMBAM
MNADCLDEAAEMLSELTTARAAFYTALVMKKMAQRESPQRGVQQALLHRERAALQLALERGRREPDTSLVSSVRAQLEDLEGRMSLVNMSNGSYSDQAVDDASWMHDTTPPARPSRISSVRRPKQSSTPNVDPSFYATPGRPAEADQSGASEVTVDSPTRQSRIPTSILPGSSEFVELQLRSLSLHQELLMSQLRQVHEANQSVLRELRDSHHAVLTEVKQQQAALDQLSRQREDSEYVDEYAGGYEGDYDPYTDYSHLEAAAASGSTAPPLVAAGPPHPVPPPPAPLGYSPFRGPPAYPGYPPPHLGYPLPPPPPLGRPLPPPLPPQQFYSPQVAAAAAAVPTPGLCLAEGQPLPQFTFDISQPPPSTHVASSTASHVASGDGRASAFSCLAKPPTVEPASLHAAPPPPATSIQPVSTVTPPKPPNAPHAFQIPLPATTVGHLTAVAGPGVSQVAPSFPIPAAVTPTAVVTPKSAAGAPHLHGLLAGATPISASVAPEKQTPFAAVGTRTPEASPGVSVQTPSPAAPRRMQRVSTGSDDYVEEVEVEGNFTPLIPLPEEVSVCTGEENEKVCFEERAKLFRYVDKEWKERGIGVVKLLENKEGKVRLLMRREQVLKVCANHYIHPGMSLKPMPKKDTAWIWDAQDYADGEAHPEKFCIRFKTPEIARQFKEAFEQAVAKSTKATMVSSPAMSTAASTGGALFSPSSFATPKTTLAPSVSTAASPALSLGTHIPASIVASGSPPTSLPHLPATGFGKMFHPKPGAWGCHTCYVSNDANKLTCAACDSPKPGTNKPKTAEAPVAVPQPAVKALGPTSSSFGSALGKLPSTQAAPAGPEFKFGITMPDQKTNTPSSSVFGGAISDQKGTSAVGSLFGGGANNSAPSSVFGATGANQKGTTPFGSLFGSSGSDQKGTASFTPAFGGTASDQKGTAAFTPGFGGTASDQKGTASFTPAFGGTASDQKGTAAFTPGFGGTASDQKGTASFTPGFGGTASDQKGTAAFTPGFGGTASDQKGTAAFTPGFGGTASDQKGTASFTPAFGGTASDQKGTAAFTHGFAGTASDQKGTAAFATGLGGTASDQKGTAAFTPAFGGTVSDQKGTGKNVFGGFTFSSPPKVKEIPKEETKPVAAVTTVKEPPKQSPFAGFSFKSSTAAKEDETPEPASATQSFLAGARSEINKLSLAPSKPQPQVTSPLSSQPQVPSLSSHSEVTSPVAKPSPPTSSATRQRANSLRSPGEVPEDFVPSAEFEPVVSLPELVEVKTGEEDEEVLFCDRAKLYRFDAETKQWKERGIGQLKILRHPETRVCRVLMRRDQVLKLCANHRILPEMKLVPLSTSDRAWSWFANDYSEGKLCEESLAVRFKTREQADHFKQTFEKCRDEAQPIAQVKDAGKHSSDVKVPEAEAQKPVEPAAPVPLSQLSEFKPKPGSWNCDICYVSNPADQTSCAACETPRPGAASCEPTQSPLKALEKFVAPISSGGGFPLGSTPAGIAPPKFTFGCPIAGSGTQPTSGSLNTPSSTPQLAPAASKASGFVFGSVRPTSAAPPSTFTFGMAPFKTEAAPATGAPAATTATPTAFKFGSPQKYEFSFSGVRPRSPGKTPKSPGTPTDAEEEESGTIESPEAEIYFQPVVPLPPKVEVRTGEEEEDVLYSHRAKLFRWMDGEWKERGLGDIKLLYHPATQRTRLLMRREPVLKVCLNHLLTPELLFNKKDDRVVTWSATDFSDDVASPYQFALRFRSAQVADEFLAAVEQARKKTPDTSLPSAAQMSKEPTTSVDASTFSFRLDGAAGSTASSTPGAFSLGSRFGSTKQTVVRSLFGNTTPSKDSADEDVLVVCEVKASPEDVARARALKLPDNFYLYENKEPCPGCRGCEDWEDKKKTLAASSAASASHVQRSSAKAAPHLAAADSTTGNQEDEGSEGGGLFGSAAQVSFADLAKQQSGAGFGLQGPSPKSGQSLFSGAGSKLFQSSPARRKSEAEDEGGDEVAPSADIHFEPVVPLPDLVELRTGEEDEEALFCHRAKLYLFDSHNKQWKERAIGDIKILKHKTRPCCFRVLMRRDQVHKIACNHSITEFTKLSPLSTSSNSLTWKALDFSEGRSSPEAFAVRFKNAEIMDTFAKVFEDCRLAVVDSGSQTVGSERNGELEEKQPDEDTTKEDEEEEEEDIDEEEEYEDEDDEHGEDIMFEKRITLAVQKPGGGGYEHLGMGNLRMVYDDSCFGARIRVIADDGSVLCDNIVAVQTCLRTERLQAYWTAVDMSLDPHTRRHFQATFSSSAAIAEFSRIFAEAKELAVNSSIVETIDEPPSRPK